MQAFSASLFKFRNLSEAWPPWVVSLAIHSLPFMVLGVAVLIQTSAPEDPFPFDVIEAPSLAQRVLPPVATAPLEPKKEEVVKKRAVFGASRKSLVSDEGLAIKAGNTVAKTPDDTKLDSTDDDTIPIPTDEYLVTRMPESLGEVRVPLPEEAKKKKIQGTVVLDILIDEQGRVREAILVQGPGMGLNEAAAGAVMRMKFKPAYIESKPVAVRIRYSYNFVWDNG